MALGDVLGPLLAGLLIATDWPEEKQQEYFRDIGTAITEHAKAYPCDMCVLLRTVGEIAPEARKCREALRSKDNCAE
jgi:hypothetical protein